MTERPIAQLSASTVGFIRIGDEGRALLGSGTLVAAGESRAILTAPAVLDRLPTSEPVGIVLRTDLNQIYLDTADLIYRQLMVDGGGALGLVMLSSCAALRLVEARRFVELAAARASTEAGAEPAWCVNGFSTELTMTQLPLDCFDMVVGYTSVTGLHDGEINTDAGAEIELQVRGVSETGAPLRLEGIEGGGLWRARGSDATFSGVVISAPNGATISGMVRCIGPSALDALERCSGASSPVRCIQADLAPKKGLKPPLQTSSCYGSQTLSG